MTEHDGNDVSNEIRMLWWDELWWNELCLVGELTLGSCCIHTSRGEMKIWSLL